LALPCFVVGAIINGMSELDVSQLISVERAREIIDAAKLALRIAELPLGECSGLRLAGALKADRDFPPFDKSLMDGFAVRTSDLAVTPREMMVAGHITAGEEAAPLAVGKVAAIMTGAPLPVNADAVVPIEHTERGSSDGAVRFKRSAAVGDAIMRRGMEVRRGETVLQAGVRLGAAQIAVAASVGGAKLRVFQVPSVGVLGTGDELVGIDEVPGPSQIRSCNTAMLMALLQNFPCRPVDLGLVADDPALIRRRIQEGLEAHDILLITGGMSKGERDYVPRLLRELGGELLITQLRIKPGKPFIFAKFPNDKYVFGLPGNPVSAYVCGLLFAGRFLRIISGMRELPERVAPLATPLEPNGNRTFCQPADYDGKELRPLKWKGSADVFTLSLANSLIIRPENHIAQMTGAEVSFLRLD
jgi:molybdopterin molybdotransferase